MVNTPLDPNVFRIELPCTHCGKVDMQLIGKLVGVDEIACRFCTQTINLKNEKWQTSLREMIDGLREIYIKS